VDESTKPTDLEDAASLQRGILTCTWGGKDKTDDGYDQVLSLFVDPDGTADFPANLPWLKARLIQHPAINAYGDESVSGCVAGGGFQCFGDVLAGSYWVTVNVHDMNSQHKVSIATANSRLQQVMKVIVPALQAADQPAAPWVAPTGQANAFCAKPNNLADARTAFASPGLNYDSDPRDTGSEASTLALDAQPWAECTWYQPSDSDTPKGQVSSASVAILDGGAWAISQMAADPPTQWYFGSFKPITVPGTAGALLACNNADCEALVGIGVNAASIGFSNLGTSRNLAGVTAMVAAIKAS
jgi:hypothetical protein